MNEKDLLTNAEKLVVEQILQGLDNKKVAKILSISPYTVKAHLENIYYKLGVNNRVQLAIKLLK